MEPVKEYRFTVHMSAEEFQLHYQGHVHAIVVTTWAGTRIQLPAFRFRPFFASDGIHGGFFLVLDDNNKFVSMQRIK